MKDEELKRYLENAFSLSDVVSTRIETSLNSLPSRRTKPTLTRFLTIHWRNRIVPTMIVFLLIVVCISVTPTIASSYLTHQAIKQEAYIIHGGHYYFVTGNQVDYSELDEEVAEVTRVGIWNIKKDGDTNHFLPTSPIYQVKGEQDIIAVKTTFLNIFESYIELERAEAVEEPSPETITGAKGDPEETSIALENAKDRMQMVYAFPQDFERTELSLVSIENEHFVKLHYQIPEADVGDIQGMLFILQYSKEQEIPAESWFTPNMVYKQIDENKRILFPDPDFTPPESKESFTSNNIEWHYYSDELIRGELEGMYYEIQTQGNFTKYLLIELLKHFKPNEKMSK